jgi:hypothetical protein
VASATAAAVPATITAASATAAAVPATATAASATVEAVPATATAASATAAQWFPQQQQRLPLQPRSGSRNSNSDFRYSSSGSRNSHSGFRYSRSGFRKSSSNHRNNIGARAVAMAVAELTTGTTEPKLASAAAQYPSFSSFVSCLFIINF